MKFGKFGGAILFSSCFGLNVGAQQTLPPAATGQPRTANQAQADNQQRDTKGNDDMLAHCLIVDNQAVVALARMAEGKTQNEEVKKFASMMQKDHQAFAKKLQNYSPNTRGDIFESNESTVGQNSARNAAGNPNERSSLKPAVTNNPLLQNAVQKNQQPENDQTNTSRTQQSNNAKSPQGEQGLNLIEIHEELAQQCLSDAKANLTAQSGYEFDKCFVGIQIAAHGAMLSKLTVFERHATDDLKQVINEGKQSAQKHMEQAEELMEKLSSDSDK